MKRPTKPYHEVKELLGTAAPAWEALLGDIRYHYMAEEKWAEGKPTHKHYNNLFVRIGGKAFIALALREHHFIGSVTLGKEERETFDHMRDQFGEEMIKQYDSAEVLHDGKWLGFHIHDISQIDDIVKILHMKRKPNRKIKPNNIQVCGTLDLGLSKDDITTLISS